MGFLDFEIPFWNIKFGLGQEKSPNTKLYQGWIVFSIYIILCSSVNVLFIEVLLRFLH